VNNNRKKLKHLAMSWKSCADCDLSIGRTNVVFYRGNPDAKIIVMGEAPGRDEDEQGEPFVGQAGKVLDSFLFSSGLNPKKDVFIMNVVGCRPPNNRQPKREETKACSSRTNYMIELVDPKVILLLGATAAKLADVLSIGPWRGKPVEVELKKTYRAVITYHPSFYLRQGKSKEVERKMLSDIRVARAIGRDK